MPNQPRVDNPRRSVRVEDDLWARAEAHATNVGVTVSDVVRAALKDYMRDPPGPKRAGLPCGDTHTFTVPSPAPQRTMEERAICFLPRGHDGRHEERSGCRLIPRRWPTYDEMAAEYEAGHDPRRP